MQERSTSLHMLIHKFPNGVLATSNHPSRYRRYFLVVDVNSMTTVIEFGNFSPFETDSAHEKSADF